MNLLYGIHKCSQKKKPKMEWGYLSNLRDSLARFAFLWWVLAGWDKCALKEPRPEGRCPRRAGIETCGLKSVEGMGQEGEKTENGENGDAEGDQSNGWLLRMSISPPRVLDIKSLSYLSSQRSPTLSQTYTGKKGLMDVFQVVFLSSQMTPFKIRTCSNIQRRLEINIMRLMESPPPLPNMLGKSFQ